MKLRDLLNERMLNPKSLKRMKELSDNGSVNRLKAAAERIRKDLLDDGFEPAEVETYIAYLARTNK